MPGSTRRTSLLYRFRYLICLLVAAGCMWMLGHWLASGAKSIDDVLNDVTISEKLIDHAQNKVQKEIVKVTDGVYVAIGYALANSILVECPTGVIIVDTTENMDAAAEIRLAFRQIIPHKPIRAIVYTHSHPDHVTGAASFFEDDNDRPDIYGFKTLGSSTKLTLVAGPKIGRGSVHQFGVRLGRHLVDVGIGPRVLDNITSGRYPLMPTKLISAEREDATIAGLNVTFIHIPGETPDHMAVWIPSSRVLLPGDDIYRSFPNLYAIRGTPPRDITEWAKSIRKMRDLNADYVVPSHTRPVVGRQTIYDLFTVYASGIQFIHDQTVRLANKFLHPDEIARRVRLPEAIRSHPYWRELYGRVDWSVKGVFEQYFGWFSGDPVELLPVTPTERARRLATLIGREKMLDMAETALAAGDHQWSLELASHVRRLDVGDRRAGDIRLKALQRLASAQWNPLARNFYMTAALDQLKLVDWKLDPKPVVSRIPLRDLLDMMRYRLQPELTNGVDMTVVFNYTDVGQLYRVRIVDSVLELDDHVTTSYDVKLTSSSTTWRRILSQERSPIMAYITGEIKVDGSVLALRRFMSYFDRRF